MKFGANSLLWTANFDEEHLSLLPKVKGMGFDGFEIARFAFDGFPAADVVRPILPLDQYVREEFGDQVRLVFAQPDELFAISQVFFVDTKFIYQACGVPAC